MEDSTLTTIEFLRARLLSERSASKPAKQKADELAKRVGSSLHSMNFFFVKMIVHVVL